MRAYYRPDPGGMRQLGQSPEMGQAMQEAAKVGQRWAEGAAPRDTGEYAGSFRVAPATVQGGWRHEDRAGAALINDAPHAGIVESRHRILARSTSIIEGNRQ